MSIKHHYPGETMRKFLNALLLILVGMAASAILFVVVSPPRGTAVELLPPPTPAPILIQVDGAVRSPGVYPVDRDSRVRDAIEAAGGLSDDANTAAINMAAWLKDGDKVIITVKGTPAAPPPTQATSKAPSRSNPVPQAAPGQPINLNTATLDDLETLPGIGATRAQQIIDYREAHGGFKSIDEIQNVSGIGAVTYEKLKALITVE